MPKRVLAALFVAMLTAHSAPAQTPPPDSAKEMVGAWEISNAARDKTCAVTFALDGAPGGFKLGLDTECAKAFPSLKDVAVWALGPNDSVRLFDSKGAVILDFTEVEARMYEAERKGEGLYFMRTQAAVRDDTVTPERVFGDWTLFKEFEKPLCKLTLSNAPLGPDTYQLTVKPGCDASIAGMGFSNWRLERDELLLSGRSGAWRFGESDSTTWERIPPSTDPLVLMRQ
jgi:hypothetical protein